MIRSKKYIFSGVAFAIFYKMVRTPLYMNIKSHMCVLQVAVSILSYHYYHYYVFREIFTNSSEAPHMLIHIRKMPQLSPLILRNRYG